MICPVVLFISNSLGNIFFIIVAVFLAVWGWKTGDGVWIYSLWSYSKLLWIVCKSEGTKTQNYNWV